MNNMNLIGKDTANVVLFGGNGYIGGAFKKALEERKITYFAPESTMMNLLQVGNVEALLEAMRPSFIINCAGATGKPNVDACEDHKEETHATNVNIPFNLAQICDKLKIPWGHVSSGCIYNGYEKDFTEEDEPNFSFDNPPCSYYSGTKAEAEKVLKDLDCYVWRLRIPFDEFDSPRNYLTKVLTYETLLDVENSVSHRADFVEACLDLWDAKAEYGIYNVTNSGPITASEVLSLFEKHHGITSSARLMDNVRAFYEEVGVKAPRSNCVLDNSKLLNAGVKIRDAEEALEESIKRWS